MKRESFLVVQATFKFCVCLSNQSASMIQQQQQQAGRKERKTISVEKSSNFIMIDRLFVQLHNNRRASANNLL